MPDYLADEGWTLTAFAIAALRLAFETILLFFARVLIVATKRRLGDELS